MSKQKSIVSYYDKIAKLYDQKRFSPVDQQYLHYCETSIIQGNIEKYMESKVKKSIVAIDIPCGTGRITKALLEKPNIRTIAIDCSKEMLGVMHNKIINSVCIQSDAFKLPIADESVDIITSAHFTGHLPRCSLFLSEVYRVLKRDGLFIVDFPNKLCFSNLHRATLKKGYEVYTRKFSFYEIKNDLQQSKFKIINYYSYNYCSPLVRRLPAKEVYWTALFSIEGLLNRWLRLPESYMMICTVVR